MNTLPEDPTIRSLEVIVDVSTTHEPRELTMAPSPNYVTAATRMRRCSWMEYVMGKSIYGEQRQGAQGSVGTAACLSFSPEGRSTQRLPDVFETKVRHREVPPVA